MKNLIKITLVGLALLLANITFAQEKTKATPKKQMVKKHVVMKKKVDKKNSKATKGKQHVKTTGKKTTGKKSDSKRTSGVKPGTKSSHMAIREPGIPADSKNTRKSNTTKPTVHKKTVTKTKGKKATKP